MSALSAAGWGIFLVGTGVVTGTVVDSVVNRLLRSYVEHPLLRAVVQVGVGVVLLGQVLQAVLASDFGGSPIGDGPLMLFFFATQANLLADIAMASIALRRAIGGHPGQGIVNAVRNEGTSMKSENPAYARGSGGGGGNGPPPVGASSLAANSGMPTVTPSTLSPDDPVLNATSSFSVRRR